MSQRSALNKYVDRRFREAFGEPNTSMGGDDHWSLQPPSDRLAINLLLNGTQAMPVVWVFDPNDLKEGVAGHVFKDEAQVNDVIKQIQDRVTRAA